MDVDLPTRDERADALRELVPVDAGAKRRVGIELLRAVLRFQDAAVSEEQQ